MKRQTVNAAGSVSQLIPREASGPHMQGLAGLGMVDANLDQSDLICAGLDELSRHLKWLDEDYQSGSFDRLETRLRSIVMLADQLDLRQIGQVAADVLYCLDGPSDIALAATLSRLMRLLTQTLDYAQGPSPAF